MYSYEYQDNMNVGRVCFELSLKPFKQLDDDYIESVCTELFEQWKPLIHRATGIAVMLWTSDGSEILDYSGNINDEFEWGRYIGVGNPKCVTRVPGTIWDDDRWLHVEPVLYTENPPVMHYSDLARIISAIKRVGKRLTGFDIAVGETFDPGPEFAYSEFKFERHTELNKGSIMGAWIHCAGTLNADDRKYAAYPNGIPQGTVFGEFLSKQFEALSRDVGFDYLWLSNGFGFSLEGWNWTGELFDGKKFDFENADKVRKSIAQFWDHYTPNTNFVTEVRGSNLSTAMDIATDGCPIDYIYQNNIIAPPNSPWAALDSRFGLELVGYMSHMANVPENGYAFRYYTHDPWWINCPWFDRYGRSPHDIYLPLAVTRIDENGKTQKPYGINFLSADDSLGNLPRRCPNEVIPHLLESFRTYPDAPGLVTWLYPFEGYCDMGLRQGLNDRMLMDDWFIESAIDGGLPLNTVVSDTVFAKVDTDVFKKTIIVCPVPQADSDFEKCVLKAIDADIPVLMYGNTAYASQKIRSYIGVECTEALSGCEEYKLVTDIYKDTYENNAPADVFLHDSLLSGGGLCEISDGSTEVVVTAKSLDGKAERVYATFNSDKKICWIRGSFPYYNGGADFHLPQPYKLSEKFNTSRLMRPLLSLLGVSITFEAFDSGDKLPLVLASAFKNGYYFTAFCKDETIKTSISTHLGAPIIMNTSALVENDTAKYSLPKCLHEECRVFVKQKEKSKINCRVETVGATMYSDRRISVTGLVNADLVFIPETESECRVFLDTPKNATFSIPFWIDSNTDFEIDENGYVIVKNVTGRISIAWQDKKTREEYTRMGYIKE